MLAVVNVARRIALRGEQPPRNSSLPKGTRAFHNHNCCHHPIWNTTPKIDRPNYVPPITSGNASDRILIAP
jgi:hypothetical protein